MADLLRKPSGTSGKVQNITHENARSSLSPNWNYVGFDVHHLSPGDRVEEATGNREVILVLVEGRPIFRQMARILAKWAIA